MELTPNEMRNHKFPSSMRGYNRAEVDAYIQGAADALEEARAQILALTEEHQTLQGKYEELKQMQETIKAAILEAQKNAEQMKDNAKKEAELIINEAKLRRDKIIDEKYRKMAEVEARIHELEYTKTSFYNKLRSEIEAHLRLVNSILPPADESKQPNEPEPPPSHKRQPEPQQSEPEQDRPRFDMKDEEINRVVDRLGSEPLDEEEQEKEKVENGQPQGNDF